MNLFIKKGNRLTDMENSGVFLWLPKGKGREGYIGSMGNRCTLPYIKQINNKDLLYSTGNYIQYLVINYNVKE